MSQFSTFVILVEQYRQAKRRFPLINLVTEDFKSLHTWEWASFPSLPQQDIKFLSECNGLGDNERGRGNGGVGGGWPEGGKPISLRFLGNTAVFTNLGCSDGRHKLKVPGTGKCQRRECLEKKQKGRDGEQRSASLQVSTSQRGRLRISTDGRCHLIGRT